MSEEITWFPTLQVYNPNISKEKWLEILDNRNLTTEQNLHILACMYHFGGEATCTQLAQKYNETKNTYNSGFSYYAKNLVKAKICKEPPYKADGSSQWWPVLFVGHDADKDTPGSYVWKLRDELNEACTDYGIEKWLNIPPFDMEAFKKALAAYKKDFNSHIDDELYKWEAIKHFQENWNIDAPDFSKMLDNAFAKTSNLLANVNNFPLAMLKEFCTIATEDIRSAFKVLYDETLPVSERIQNFINVTDKINSNYKPDKNTYQSTNAISTYLWLRYPDKYIIYKYSELDNVSQVLNALYEPESGSIETVEDGFYFYNQLSQELRKDQDLIEMINSKLTDTCYSDPEFKTLTIDFGFFISRYYHKNWIVPCNPNDYNLDGAFKKYQVLNWKQSRNYSVGDYAYIYVSTTQKRISYKTVVTRVDVPADEVIHDEEFEINNDGYKDSKKMEIKLVGTSTDEGLTYSELKKHGLKSNLQSAEIIKPDMFEYIDSFFMGDNMTINKLSEYRYPTNYYRMQMNDANGNRIAEPMIDKGLITASIDYAGEEFEYLNKGDVVLVHKGSYPIALVAVIEKQKKLDELSFGIDYSVDVLIDYRKIVTDYNNVPRSGTFFSVRDKTKEIYKFIDKEYLSIVGDYKMNHYIELLKENKNIILHGAPGTGKTFLAKKIAEAMGCSKDEIGFCQFHPSYDYTDFVEGLRPNKNNGFERRDGIFKAFCKKALQNQIDSEKSVTQIQTELSWQEKIKVFLDDAIENKIECPLKKNGCVVIESYHDDIVDITLPGNESHKDDSIHISKLHKVLSSDKPFESAIEIERYLEGFHSAEYSYILAVYKKIKEYQFDSKTTVETVSEVKPKNYIFIIDEINRGELSKIFGELFFSIDPGYRGKEGLVNTQYQNLIEEDLFKDGFYIPENVYIIGTMNDIDRSVESMDFAMRRRFIFKEVTADECAENMQLSQDVKERMTRVNNQISKTEGLNSAYHIGGAYFRNVTDFDKLWNLKLSSLVKEYLRGMDDDDSKYKKIENAYFGKSENTVTDEAESGASIE